MPCPPSFLFLLLFSPFCFSSPSLSPRDSLLLFVYPSAFRPRRRRRTTPSPPSFHLSSLNIRELYLFHSRCFRSSILPHPPQTRFARSLASCQTFRRQISRPSPSLHLPSPYLPCPRLLNAPLCLLRFLLDKEEVVVPPSRETTFLSLPFLFAFAPPFPPPPSLFLSFFLDSIAKSILGREE